MNARYLAAAIYTAISIALIVSGIRLFALDLAISGGFSVVGGFLFTLCIEAQLEAIDRMERREAHKRFSEERTGLALMEQEDAE